MDFAASMSRRRGGALRGLALAATIILGLGGVLLGMGTAAAAPGGGDLPVTQIQQVMQAQGMVSNGVLTIEQDRNDLHVTGPGGIPFKSSWEINNQFFFQPLGGGQAILNGDVALLTSETQPFIDKLLANGITFQAFHQHFFDLSPMVYFMHFRAVGDPVHLAQSAAAAVSATATPLPQTMPMHPSTPLDSAALGQALGGDAMVGSDGVVTVTIPRQNSFTLGGVPTQSDTGLATTVAFEPLAGGQTAVAPDFALTAAEVQPVMGTMRGQGFTIHCLYNQETAENPQLYFSHQLKTGDALQLAQQIRKGLDQTNSQGSQAATPPSGGANTGAGGTAGGRPIGELAGGIAALAAALLAGAAVIRRRSTDRT